MAREAVRVLGSWPNEVLIILLMRVWLTVCFAGVSPGSLTKPGTLDQKWTVPKKKKRFTDMPNERADKNIHSAESSIHIRSQIWMNFIKLCSNNMFNYNTVFGDISVRKPSLCGQNLEGVNRSYLKWLQVHAESHDFQRNLFILNANRSASTLVPPHLHCLFQLQLSICTTCWQQ